MHTNGRSGWGRTGMILYMALTYGILTRLTVSGENQGEAKRLTGLFLMLCHENGIYEYFE